MNEFIVAIVADAEKRQERSRRWAEEKRIREEEVLRLAEEKRVRAEAAMKLADRERAADDGDPAEDPPDRSVVRPEQRGEVPERGVLEGGTYTVGVVVDPGYRTGNSYSFNVGFDAAPADVDRLVDAAIEEVQRLQHEGLGPALFEAAVSLVRDSYAAQMNSPDFWTQYLLDEYHEQGDVTEILKRCSLVANILTNKAINVAAQRYFGVDNFMRFVLLPDNS